MLDYTYLPPESPDARDEAATIEAMHIGYANGWIAPAAPAPARLAAIPSPAVTEVQRLKAVVASLVDERNAANARAEAAELSLRLIEADNRDLADAHYCIAGYKAALALVDEYGRCCAHDASFGNESPSFAAWLAQRVGEAAADVAEWLKPATAALEANAWQRQNDPRAVQL